MIETARTMVGLVIIGVGIIIGIGLVLHLLERMFDDF